MALAERRESTPGENKNRGERKLHGWTCLECSSCVWIAERDFVPGVRLSGYTTPGFSLADSSAHHLGSANAPSRSLGFTDTPGSLGSADAPSRSLSFTNAPGSFGFADAPSRGLSFTDSSKHGLGSANAPTDCLGFADASYIRPRSCLLGRPEFEFSRVSHRAGQQFYGDLVFDPV